MVFERGGCIYIMANKTHSVLYVGVTSDLLTRVWQHKNKVHSKSFTAKYNCIHLVYYCAYSTIVEAIAAEKLLKGGSRQAKINLINSLNPTWIDLYDGLLNDWSVVSSQ